METLYPCRINDPSPMAQWGRLPSLTPPASHCIRPGDEEGPESEERHTFGPSQDIPHLIVTEACLPLAGSITKCGLHRSNRPRELDYFRGKTFQKTNTC